MNKAQLIEKEITELNKRLQILYVERDEAYKDTYYTCKHCGIKKQLRNYVFVEYEWYDENTGSPCGGYYEHGSFHIGCPNCGQYWENKLDENYAYKISRSCREKIIERDKD